jgi:hypothetical protein
MKRNSIYFFSLLALTFCLAAGVEGYGQGKKIEKSYRWSYPVNPDVSLEFNNYNCKLTIHTWDKPEIAYTMTVDATLRTEEDARRLDSYIEKLEFTHAVSKVSFDNRFWTSKKAVMGKKTMGLKGEKTIRFHEFTMQGELWIPESCIFHLTSKYSEIEVEDLKGRVYLDLYNDKFYGKKVLDHIDIAAKYCTMEFGEMRDIRADLYNTTVEAGDIGSLSMVSKYSRFEAGNAGKVEIDAYSDKYTLGKTGDIRFIDKYSDLTAVQAGHAELDCYSSTVNIDRVEDVELKSKYGSFTIGEARKLDISSAYSDKFDIKSLRSLNLTDSRYGVYEIGYLENSLLLSEGYSDKLFIEESGEIKGVNVNGKYVVLEMVLGEALSYRFRAEVKYPKFRIDEDSMDVRRKIKEGSELEMEAVKGPESEEMASFFISGYEMAVTLTEQ